MSTITRINRSVAQGGLVLLLLAALLGAAVISPTQARPADKTYIVDTLTDGHDSHLADGICHNGADGCSLRAAIEEAFTTYGSTSIYFDPSLSGKTLRFKLGPINWAASNTLLDGETNKIHLSGEDLSPGESLLNISGSQNIVRNLWLQSAPENLIRVGDLAGVGEGNSNTLDLLTLYSCGSHAVVIHGSSSGGGQGNSLTNSLVGASGWDVIEYTECAAGEGAGGDGVRIEPGANYASVTANRIVCSAGNGVHVAGLSGSPEHALISENYIGTNGSSYFLGNGANGIAIINAGAQDIGTSTTNEQVIAGNAGYGILIQNSTGVMVDSTNLIGKETFTWHGPIRNHRTGVMVQDSANNIIRPKAVVYNEGAGIAVTGNASINNTLLPERDIWNSGKAIDLGDDGDTLNGTHSPPGPNNWLPYPSVTTSQVHHIGGTTCSNCVVYIYDDMSPGYGVTDMVTQIMHVTANAAGAWSADLPADVFQGNVVTQACRAPCTSASDTSELSPRLRYHLLLPVTWLR